MPERLLDLRRLTSAAACAGAGLLLLVSTADAQSGGGATADPDGKLPKPSVTAAPDKTTGGRPAKVVASPKPMLITCRLGCSGLDVVRPGGVVRVSGDAMGGAATVVFKGARATGDEASAPAAPISADAVDVVVPANAVSGPVQILDANGKASRTTGKTVTVISPSGRVAQANAAPDARVEVKKVFFRGPHQANLSVFIPEGSPRHVVVDLLRVSDGKSVGHWELNGAGGTVQSVAWSGVVSGDVQPDGRYRFRVSEAVPGATAAQASDPLTPSFTFLQNIFPIRGKHDFGGDVARFGTGRTGHTHQGQDTFADCGTPLVAARGGKVKFQGFQSAAGNYIVIDAAGTGVDYVYMHLKDPALAVKGDSVYTGQPIGEVGDTGDADGCHLHMELWSPPGWYTGGSPFDPLPSLKKWDKQS